MSELILTLILDTIASWIRIFIALALSIIVAWIVGITAAKNNIPHTIPNQTQLLGEATNENASTHKNPKNDHVNSRQPMSQKEKAEAFRALHHGKHILILPNAWDVPSARIFEEAGFPAIATSSAGLMVSLGYQDGETISKSEFLAAVGRIARVLSVPLSVDAVSGFGETPAEVASTIQSLVKIGAVGINIEDLDTATGNLFDMEEQVAKLKAIRKLDDSTGIPLVINARTDALRHAMRNDKERLAEAIRRSQAYRDAGADCVYPMGLTDAASISTFVKALDFPVNVMVRRGLPPIKELERLGVARVSFGPAASYATMGFLKRASAEVLEKGTYENLVEGAITYDELNSLAAPRPSA